MVELGESGEEVASTPANHLIHVAVEVGEGDGKGAGVDADRTDVRYIAKVQENKVQWVGWANTMYQVRMILTCIVVVRIKAQRGQPRACSKDALDCDL